MWQLPLPVSMTGTADCSTTARMSPAPPRGTRTSMRPRARMSAAAPALPAESTVATRSAGRAASDRAARRTSTMAALVASAALPPRSTTALPDFRVRAATSTVTLGRAS